jgi:hypothetical protein
MARTISDAMIAGVAVGLALGSILLVSNSIAGEPPANGTQQGHSGNTEDQLPALSPDPGTQRAGEHTQYGSDPLVQPDPTVIRRGVYQWCKTPTDCSNLNSK